MFCKRVDREEKIEDITPFDFLTLRHISKQASCHQRPQEEVNDSAYDPIQQCAQTVATTLVARKDKALAAICQV